MESDERRRDDERLDERPEISEAEGEQLDPAERLDERVQEIGRPPRPRLRDDVDLRMRDDEDDGPAAA